MLKRLSSLAACFVLVITALYLSGCTSVRYQAYPGFENLPATPWKQVRVFWTDPRVSFEPVGEAVIRGCRGCSLAIVEDRIKIAVSDLGGEIGIVVRDEAIPVGTVGSGSVSQIQSPSGRTYYAGISSASVVNERDIIVIAAILESREGSR